MLDLVVKSNVLNYLPFQFLIVLLLTYCLILNFIYVFVVQLVQGSCLYVISNEHLSVCQVFRVYHRNLIFAFCDIVYADVLL